MNRREKQALAGMVLGQVADLVEHWSESVESDPNQEILSRLDPQEAKQVIANWLQYLPGEEWDERLPYPQKRKKGISTKTE